MAERFRQVMIGKRAWCDGSCGMAGVWRDHAPHVPVGPFAPVTDPPPVADDEETVERLRDALRVHHPIMRSETGPFSGCRCGQVRLGQDVIAHVVARLALAARGEGRRG